MNCLIGLTMLSFDLNFAPHYSNVGKCFFMASKLTIYSLFNYASQLFVPGHEMLPHGSACPLPLPFRPCPGQRGERRQTVTRLIAAFGHSWQIASA